VIKQLFLDKRQDKIRNGFLAVDGEIHQTEYDVTIPGSEDVRQQFTAANDRYWFHLKLLRASSALAAVGFVIRMRRTKEDRQWPLNR